MSLAIPATRQEVIDYALIKLGYPVLEIPIDDIQADICVEDALRLFREYHSDATERVYVTHTLTSTDITNKYITLPDAVENVARILPSNISGGGLFSPDFQIRQELVLNWNYSGLVTYELFGEYISMLDIMFNRVRGFEFNRAARKLYIDMPWSQTIAGNSVIVLEVYRQVDPAVVTKLYSDRWFLAYVVELMRLQYATNLSKYKDMQLPGGVTLNATEIMSTAVTNIEKLQDEVRTVYSAPPRMYIG